MPKSNAAPVEVKNLTIPIDALQPHPRNYKSHPEAQLGKLSASIARFGQVRSCVVQEGAPGRYLIVAGHGFIEAAKREGLDEIRADVIPATWDDDAVVGYLIADNETGNSAVDDMEALAQLLQEQADAGYHLESLGSSQEELDALLEELTQAALGDETRAVDDPGGGGDDFDTTPDEGPTRTQPGDIWACGQHKIYVGDSFDAQAIERLLAGERPDMLLLDPPYGMRLDADFSGMVNALGESQSVNLRHGHKYADVIGDHEDFDAAPLVAQFADVKEQFWFGADYYAATLGDTMHTGAWLVWDKRLDEDADRMFGSCFELIWSRQKHKRDILRHMWAGLFGLQYEPQKKRQHPNQKPIALLVDIIQRYSEEGALIVDLFLGSGSTLVSCERTGRRCFGAEISPQYADICLRRYEAESGETAVLLSRLAPAEAG